jgi:cytochrome d ubiquinol oxidase subunit II
MSLVIGYALLGACWLIWKTDGALQDHARHLARPLAISLVVAIAAVSAATPFLEGRYYERWFSWPGVLASAQMPVLVAITSFALARAINGRRHWMPFLITLVLFALSMVGLAISVWPDVIPARVSIWQAAAPERSQVFMLIGAAALVPIILGYTIWAYWVFRGKVDEAEYY